MTVVKLKLEIHTERVASHGVSIRFEARQSDHIWTFDHVDAAGVNAYYL